MVEPYAKGDILHEFQDETNNDPSSGEVGGGVRWRNDQLALNADLEVTKLIGQSDYDQWTLKAIIAKGFHVAAMMGTVSPKASLGMSAQNSNMVVGLNFQHDQADLMVGISVGMTQPLMAFGTDAKVDDAVTSRKSVNLNLAYNF
ncbi:MAG: hypothetical protein JKY27_03945 [Magnetovibrio sp.]|nr:hypothetical protein [Magnetovibrio sp.]